MWRVLWAALAAATVALPPRRSEAAPAGTRACIEAHREAQIERGKSQLRTARARLEACVKEECPAPIQKECATWLTEVEAAIPTIVVSGTDASGRDISTAVVSIDGEEVARRLDGKPIAVDPGEHRITIMLADGQKQERTVVVGQSEKDRRVALVLPPVKGATRPRSEKPRPARPATKSSSPTLGWVLVGVGAVGTASFGYFGVSGYRRENDLADSCSPHCAKSDVDGVHRSYLVADVSLGVGLVALAVGTVILLSSGDSR
jgi:hypothetical protein